MTIETTVETIQKFSWKSLVISLGTVDLAGEWLKSPVESARTFVRKAERRGNTVVRRIEKGDSLAQKSFQLAGKTIETAADRVRTTFGITVVESAPARPRRAVRRSTAAKVGLNGTSRTRKPRATSTTAATTTRRPRAAKPRITAVPATSSDALAS